jgi:hypothetical protein
MDVEGRSGKIAESSLSVVDTVQLDKQQQDTRIIMVS